MATGIEYYVTGPIVQLILSLISFILLLLASDYYIILNIFISQIIIHYYHYEWEYD